MSHQLPLPPSSRHAELGARFWEFHRVHPEVWRLFERFAVEALRAGVRIGAKAIWERMRWETRVTQTLPGAPALNNNFTPFYARLFDAKHPGLGLFKFREQTSRYRRAS